MPATARDPASDRLAPLPLDQPFPRLFPLSPLLSLLPFLPLLPRFFWSSLRVVLGSQVVCILVDAASVGRAVGVRSVAGLLSCTARCARIFRPPEGDGHSLATRRQHDGRLREYRAGNGLAAAALGGR